MRLLRRNRWPIVIPLYDVRECRWCAALVQGDNGQHAHEGWHDRLDDDMHGPEVYQDPGGFIVPNIENGALPLEMRGGRDSETEESAR